ncbi:MAG: 4a-hydroxytetrahydrobiopterin dehydratase [Marinicellaceae bacterium]
MTKTSCNITEKKCLPCEGGVEINSKKNNQELLSQLHADWSINKKGDKIHRQYIFKNFTKTMFFVNAVAHIADQQFHHPDIQFGYNYCIIEYSTHSVDGLTENDFICAALIDKL